MEAAAAVAVDAAGLAACDSEPIHIPGSIQPHGMLLALGPRGLPVLQASANCAALFGHPVQEVIGRFLGGRAAAAGRARRLGEPGGQGAGPGCFGAEAAAPRRRCA
jgi:two-component system, chemotaxis family, sensor kinase Cph1